MNQAMFGLGFIEILFILVLALILIGPEQMPEVARAVAKFINELKRASQEVTTSVRDFEYNNKVEEVKKQDPT